MEVDWGSRAKEVAGGDRKEATASVEPEPQPRRRAEGLLSRVQAAGAFSPTRGQEGNPGLALRPYTTPWLGPIRSAGGR